MALGVAVLGSIGTALYRDRIATEIPSGLSAEATDNARATLAGALSVVRDVGGARADALAAAARDALSSSLAIAAVISASLVIATSIATLILLRRAGTAPASPDDSQVPAAA